MGTVLWSKRQAIFFRSSQVLVSKTFFHTSFEEICASSAPAARHCEPASRPRGVSIQTVINIMLCFLVASAMLVPPMSSMHAARAKYLRVPLGVCASAKKGISAALHTSLRTNSIPSLNPLQEVAVDAAMNGLDIIIHAQTGSGKTLCYALPLLAALQKVPETGNVPMQSLVLVPTLELAAQVARVCNALQGGSASAVPRDASELPRDAPIIVGPPAVLMRLMSGGATSKAGIVPRLPKDVLRELSCVVVDEADALLMPLGRYSTQKQKDARAKKPKAAATLLQLLCSQQRRRGDSAGASLQVLAASATVGRPLRRELAAVCDRKFEVVREPDSSTTDGLRIEGDAGTMSSGSTDPDTSSARSEKSERDGGSRRAPDSREVARGRPVGLAAGLSVGAVTYVADNLIGALHDVLDAEAPTDCAQGGSAAAPPLLFVQKGRSLPAELKLLNQCEFDAESLDEAILTQQAIAPTTPATEEKLEGDGMARSESPTRRRLLVATPSGARGLDLHGLGLVVIVGVPKSADEFVHLAGRTARNGASGRVVVLAAPEEADARFPTLGSQLGVDFSADRRHVEGVQERWADMWRVHEKIVGAASKGF